MPLDVTVNQSEPRQLRAYQVEAIERLRDSLRAGKRRPMLQAPTGAGKTLLASTLVNMAQAKGNKVCFVVPALSLIDQTVEAFASEGIWDVGVIQAQHASTDWSRAIQVASVQTLMRRWPAAPEAGMVIVDEAHILFEFYGKWFTDPSWLKVPFIGLSATPWTKGLGKLYDDLIVLTTTAELIEQGYLSPFRVFCPSHPDLKGVRTVAGDYHEGELSAAMDRAPLVADVVQTWLDRAEGRPTLVFGVDRAHAKHMQLQFEAAGVPAGYQDMNTDPLERRQIRDRFHAGDLKVVCNVDTLTVGVDWDVRCISLVRPTKSIMKFCLDSETELLTSHGWKGMGEVHEGDCAATLVDAETGEGRWSPVLADIERDMSPEEVWVEYAAPRANFRVTGDHTMIYRTGGDKPWRFAPARDMSRHNDSVQMLTAIEIPQPGVPLTNAELYFIGMMMTDGTWGREAGAISQSERHPEILGRIEECLRSCGIGYSKKREVLDEQSLIAEKHARWRYSFCAGKPNQTRLRPKSGYESVPGATGFRHLLPFMDKDFPPALMAISKAQFLTLLQGIHDGDGFKMKSPSVDWTPRSWTLCSARKVFIERLQALAAINGFTAHLRSDHGPSRATPIYIITITPKNWRSVGGAGPRPQVECKPSTIERVWCVQTETETIVTRRRGKVTVMGNCQIIGRGLRTAEGKDDLLILDHSDNHLRLGFVTDISRDKLHDGRKQVSEEKAVPLPKECPKCSYLRPPRVSECPSCGFKPEPRTGPEQVEGELVELLPKVSVASKLQRQRNRSGVIELHGKAIPLWQFCGELRGYAGQHGYKEGWVSNKYREAVGVWPNAHRDVKAIPPSFHVLSWIRSRNIAFAKARASG